VLDRGAGAAHASADGALRGGYVLADAPDGAAPDVILVGTGSEVHLCLAARAQLRDEGIAARVVSLPCTALFEAQPDEWRERVLPAAVEARVVVEAGVTRGWEGYAGRRGEILGLDRFGASAPGEVAQRELGFTVEEVVRRARAAMRRAGVRADVAPPMAPYGADGAESVLAMAAPAPVRSRIAPR
jgi:transketolase